MTEDRRQRTENRRRMTEDRIRKWEVGPVVVPNERDYAAAQMQKAEKKKVRR
jgi:hypothetical protein